MMSRHVNELPRFEGTPGTSNMGAETDNMFAHTVLEKLHYVQKHGLKWYSMLLHAGLIHA